MELKLRVGSVVKINGLSYEIYTFGYETDDEGNVRRETLYCGAKNGTEIKEE